ncbi:MAG: hypothetical protein PF542_04080 [Nanoarchaeota archaeon]|jgi:hypothetical protein|nr:hypothetical protein [Nanoarchaeota archaeon]
MKEKLIKELKFCIHLWETQGHCEFGGQTDCKQCAAPYLLLKLITGEVLHGKDINKLTLDDWKNKMKEIENNSKKY